MKKKIELRKVNKRWWENQHNREIRNIWENYSVFDEVKLLKYSISEMYRKIAEKVANLGTVALLGHEMGSHVVNDQEQKVEKATKIFHTR